MGAPSGQLRTALDEVVVAASSLLDPCRLAGVAVDQVRSLLATDGASLSFWDEAQEVLVPLALVDERVGDPLPVFRVGQGMSGLAFANEAACVAEDYRRDVPNPTPWSTVKSGAAVPITADGRVVGVLSGQQYTRRRFDDRDVATLELIAAQVGPALASMRTLAWAQYRTAEAHALARLMRRGTSLGNEEALYELICQSAVRLLGADLAGLVLRDMSGAATGWHGVVGNRTQAWNDRHYGDRHPGIETLFPHEVQIVSGVDGGVVDAERYPVGAAEGMRTCAYIPLDTENDRLGSLVLGWRSEATLSEGQTEFAKALATFSGTLAGGAQGRAQRQALINSAPVMLMAIDDDGIVTLCDGAAAERIGISGEDAGRSLTDIFADAPEALLEVQNALAVPITERLTLHVREHALDLQVIPRGGGAFLVATDVTERRAAEATLAWRGAHDLLTGLPNKAEVVARIDAGLPDAKMTVVLTDVRSFDGVNEAVGYEAADILLCKLGKRLAEDLSDAVVVGRTGGDEFAVVATETDAAELCSRVRRSLEAPIDIGEEDGVSVDVRCGMARADGVATGLALLRRADAALQRARRGPHEVETWDAQAARQQREGLKLSAQLRRAGDARAFDVVYQPVLDLRSNEIRAFEALSRWSSPDAVPVSADVFIPALERLGRIRQLTEHVLDQALADIAVSQGFPVSVNISRLDVAAGGLGRLVERRLDALKVDPAMLILEITETAAVQADPSSLVELADMGVALAIDDFGRGWSSIEMLEQLPASYLKLDSSYVRRAASGSTPSEIVRAAVILGRACSMRIVAEGVETPEVLEAVRRLDCDYVQGFLCARPMPLDRIGAWVAEHRGPR